VGEMKKIDKYTTLQIEDYKGVFSLIEGYEKDEVFKPSWVTELWGKEKTPKLVPKRVKLGDKAKAIEVCLYLYNELTGKDLEEPF
jgi:hypothetical protein